MTNLILENYNKKCNTRSDINEHLPILKEYAEQCEHITEFGTNACNSTSAFLASFPKKLITYDIQTHEELCAIGDLDYLLELAPDYNIEFQFKNESSVDTEIEETDLLFLDTLHMYHQLIAEMRLHHNKVKKYILAHDTEIFKYRDIRENYKNEASPFRGLMTAVEQFLKENKDWELLKHLTNCNGLTILKRK